MLSPSLGLGGYCRQHMQSEVERARTTSRLIMGKLLHNRNGRYPLSPLRKYIIPWFCLQSHIHWLLVAKWDRRIQLLILAWWPGRHTTPTPCWWPGCCRHRSRSCCEFYKYFLQPTDSDCTVTNSPSFSIGQCVNVGMHWLGCVAVYLSLKTCRDDLFVWLCVVWDHFL